MSKLRTIDQDVSENLDNISRKHRPCYSLAELIAQCDLNASHPEDMKAWEFMNAVGKEIAIERGM